jgi:hypothetical protein
MQNAYITPEKRLGSPPDMLPLSFNALPAEMTTFDDI